MEDSKIIDLYFKRDETAIIETDIKYGSFCRKISMNLLSVHEDAEECVSDAYHHVWNMIPPQRPIKFKPWLGKIVRNVSINLWHKNHTKKRYMGITAILDELTSCIPSSNNVEMEIEDAELGKCITKWLLSLSKDDRVLFVRRYWYGISLKDLAKEYGITEGRLAQKMYKLRQNLKSALEKEEIYL